MHRRRFLAASAAAVVLPSGFWRTALAQPVADGPSPYGPLAAPDADGLRLPAGFTGRVVARGGEPVADTGFVWHRASDGAGTFATADGGWILCSNSEVGGGGGGASALVLGPPVDGIAPIVGAHSVLSGTSRNCAGGVTPWGTWLSCEEVRPTGRVWECDPSGIAAAMPLDALGRFSHEAAAVDPVTGQVYLTEDERDSRLFRYTPPSPPTAPGRRPSFDGGVLEVAAVGPAGTDVEGVLSWVAVDPADPATHRPAGSRVFDRLEGAWFHDGHVFVTTTTRAEIHDIDIDAGTITRLVDGSGSVLTGADNITVHAPSGDLFVAEDGGNMELVIVADHDGTRTVAPFLAVVGHAGSEIAGPVFDPAGDRLYFASQRGGPAELGVVWEVSGPFRRLSPPPTTTTTVTTTTTIPTTTTTNPTTAPSTAAPTTSAVESAAPPDGGGTDATTVAAVVAGAAALGVGGAAVRRARTGDR